MTYATQQDLIDRYGQTELAQLTDPTAGATINTTTVARALADADAEINSYVGVRYTLPLPSTPVVILRVACDIARYNLWDNAAPDAVATRYKNAIALLKLLATGDTTLPDLPTTVQPAAGSVTVKASSRDRLFSDTLLDSFCSGG